MSAPAHTDTIATIRAERIQKSARLKAAGMPPFPSRTTCTHALSLVRDSCDALEAEGTTLSVAGRVMAVRIHGGVIFADLFDGTATVQGYLKKDTLGDSLFTLFQDTIDRGDFVEVTGTACRTKRGEASVLAQTWRILTKALLPLPTEHFGIKDEDERYRKRYLDILLDKEVADRVRARSVFWNTMRSFLLERGFVEVETPILETLPGGADARPFKTHHHALDIDVSLRISAGELWQKKLLVAGIEKTFEIGRVFRNEGMSAEHAQDYTACEFYEAYSDFEKGKVFVRDLYLMVARATFGTTAFSVRGHSFDLDAPWETYDFCTLMQDAYGFDPRESDVGVVERALLATGVSHEGVGHERAVDMLWKRIRGTLTGPGYLVNVPVYLEPLAKRSVDDPRVVERFQVILAGSEMGKGFSELNDPIDQRARFARQEAMREGGDEEAQHADAEFVEALEYGMPPAFGFGVSERLFSFLAGVSIREGQAFPLMRPRNGEN